MNSLFQSKFKMHQVTLIFSMLFILLGFSYNVWQLEVSEQNNTIRIASVEMLVELSSLQQLIYIAHYDKDLEQGNPRKGWVKVGLITDLSVLTDPTIEKKAENLTKVWSSNGEEIGREQEAVEQLVKSINSVRSEIKRVLKSLE